MALNTIHILGPSASYSALRALTTIAALALLPIASSCGGTDTTGLDDNGSGGTTLDAAACPTGAEGCACTSGGSCDKGLSCLSKVCVKLPDASAGTGGTGGMFGAGGSVAGSGGVSGADASRSADTGGATLNDGSTSDANNRDSGDASDGTAPAQDATADARDAASTDASNDAAGSCQTGLSACGEGDGSADAGPGYCADLKTDVQNCGACGLACNPGNASGPVCINGFCNYGVCTGTFEDCDNSRTNGCESNKLTDPANCGACAYNCASGVAHVATVLCQSGACNYDTCASPYMDCDHIPSNGCESDVRTDVNHCGNCGTACAVPQATTQACVDGICQLGTCNPGFADCNKVAADGCEVNTSSDVNNCSACGMKCASIPNGTPVCNFAACAVSTCNTGFKDCNAVFADGCETNLTNDINNCGNCGNKCNPLNASGGHCATSLCDYSACTGNFQDCDGIRANGCESNKMTDNFHCGSCAMNCTTTGKTCSAGLCLLTP